MCELMGLCFAKPIPADFSIHEFVLRSDENADGWGLAWYPDRSLALIKEPIKWQASQFSGFLETYPGLSAPIYIAHVRHKTTGGAPTHADTHPFTRELAGHDFCFAHNGTLSGSFWDLQLDRFKPVGHTDSEYLFCYLLGQLAVRDDLLGTESSWKWLSDTLVTCNRNGKLNVLLSDGHLLFAYHDSADFKELHFRRITLHDNEIRRFEDAEIRIDLAGAETNQGFVIATHPLSSWGWHPFLPGEMIVFDKGSIQFSNKLERAIGQNMVAREGLRT
jgi:predicted glutamine amidotransferase